MVGADDATFAELKPVFAAFCENIVHAGPPGHGIVLKLINNFIAQAICTATAEACAAAREVGTVDRQAAPGDLGGRGQFGPVPDARRPDARKRRPVGTQVHAVERGEGPALLHAFHRVDDDAVDRRRGGAPEPRHGERAGLRRQVRAVADRGAGEAGRACRSCRADVPIDPDRTTWPRSVRDAAFAEFALQAARDAGDAILPHFRAPIDVEDKGGARGYDPVTEADRAAETVIREAIARRYPDHGIEGEEHGRTPGTLALHVGDRSDRRHAQLHPRPAALGDARSR